ISLHFSEPVELSLGSVRLVTCAGKAVSTGAPEHGATDSDVVVRDIPDLANDTYVVLWRVISADAHPVHGAFSFTVGTEAQNLAGCNTAEVESSTSVGFLFGVARTLLYVGLALLIGGVVFWLAIAFGTTAARRARVIAWIGWWTTLVATISGLMLQGPYAAGTGLGDAVKWSVIDGIIDTRYGNVAVQRLVLMAAALLVLLLLGRADARKRPGTPLLVIAGIVGVLLSSTPGRAGHAATGDWTWIAIPLDTVHVAAMAVWFGGLVALIATALGGGFSGSLRRALSSFSRIAFWCVVILVITGVFASWRQIGFDVEGFTDTSFGNILLVKLVLVAILIGLAAVSRRVVRARVSADLDAPDSVVAAIDDRTVKGLRWSVAGEVFFGVTVLIASALLVQAQPARTALEPKLFSTEVTAGTGANQMLVDVTIDPAQSGANTIHVYTLTPQGETLPILRISGDFVNGQDRISADLVRGGSNHYVNENLLIPGAGEWTLALHIFRAEIGDTAIAIKVPIR
ncbi:MAG TPA: CopD family protein, partial [Acidimicrobiia bacterium]|nr:CopD family protein [Acidimicrobiia bacterium]